MSGLIVKTLKDIHPGTILESRLKGRVALPFSKLVSLSELICRMPMIINRMGKVKFKDRRQRRKKLAIGMDEMKRFELNPNKGSPASGTGFFIFIKNHF